MSFLPNDVVVPSVGNSDQYVNKFPDGESKYRVLSNAIVGYEYWTNEPKPVRSRTPFESTPNIKLNDQGKEVVNYFWAFVIWDYQSNKVKIMEVTQKTIQKGLLSYTEDPEWGDPKDYDFSVVKTKDNNIIKYAVKTSPPKPVAQEIKLAYESMQIDLNELYTNGDPFKSKAQVQPVPMTDDNIEIAVNSIPM